MSSTLETLDEVKDDLARAMKSTKVLVGKDWEKAEDYALIAAKAQAVVDALAAHLAVSPDYEWHAGKLLATCFGTVDNDGKTPVPYVGSGHAYFPVSEWVMYEGDAKDMLVWLRERVVWLES